MRVSTLSELTVGDVEIGVAYASIERVNETSFHECLEELIHKAKRPVILAGHGIIVSGAMKEVLTLAEKAGIPVALTLLGLRRRV